MSTVTYRNSTMLQRSVFLLLPLVGTAWLVAVPSQLSPSSFAALLGLLAGFVWIFRITYMNAQPASSTAQSIHDAETAAAIAGDRTRSARRDPRQRPNSGGF